MTIEYLLSFIAAIILLVAYLIMVKNKEFWLTMLFFCVPIVNLGYTLMAGAKTLSFALFGNDVAYLGSVFLCMCMFLTIVKLCGFGVRRVHVISCIAAGLAMFFIVASTNVLHLYYESVTLTMVDGSAKLVKVYGPLHPLYVVYLVGYFVIMLATIIHSAVNRKIGKPKLAGFIAAVVCSNIVVWLIEKFISWNFEMLSVTYIISEVLLLLVWWMMQDYVHKNDVPKNDTNQNIKLGIDIATMPMDVKIGKVLLSVKNGEPLAHREREILELILSNKKRKEIADELCLSENTVKTYTRTLYSKIGVSCREELYALLLQEQA